MATFPVNLPSPQIDGYGGTQDQAFIRTEMEAGSQRQRQRFSAANTQLNVTWQFSAIEMQSFKSFFDVVINRGSDFFTYSLNLGAGFIDYDVRFTQPYQFAIIQGNRWTVSSVLEVRNA
jgi:hypothetical protein